MENPASRLPTPGRAWFAGVRAAGVRAYADLRADPSALDGGGWWAVVAEFDGPWHAWRFDDVHREASAAIPPGQRRAWDGPRQAAWSTSMSRAEYIGAVEETRRAVHEGQVYQANICRVLSAALPAVRGEAPDSAALSERLTAGNPAPYAGAVDVPAGALGPGAWVVSASPELSVEVADGHVTSGPIKGTARTADGLRDKDRAENVMITDLVRNDLQRVCRPGTVRVVDLLRVEQHPGLVHLVSRVRGRLLGGPGVDWPAVLSATHPPGSVSGAPKSSALRLISRLEPVRRGPYTGQVGWIDADAGTARLAVAIRTFWWSDGVLRFGTGAGITWGSDPQAEWEETRLKARLLVGLASRD